MVFDDVRIIFFSIKNSDSIVVLHVYIYILNYHGGLECKI